MSRTARRGASLVQIAVMLGLIAVIAISSLGLFGTKVADIYTDSNIALRDAQRRADLQAITSALEFYRQRFNTYPAGAAGSDRSCWTLNQTSDASCNPLAPLVTSGLLTQVPYDPGLNAYTGYTATGCGRAQFYSYWSDGTNYLIGAQNEGQGHTGCTQLGSWRGPTDNGYTYQMYIRRGV